MSHMHNIVHRKPNLSHTTTDYVGNFVFEGGEFKRYNFDDGYIFPYWKPDTHTYCQGYNYYVKDHQGNIRMIVNNNGTVSQVNHLTAYGASMGNSYNQEFNKYKYNGKELDRMHGLDLYDYGARQYDPAIGSFTSMDPLAEKHYHINPYAYCAGNPVRYVDKDGRDYDVYYDGSSITINATYLTDDASAESAKQAVSLWNNLNGRFTMDGLPIKFDFSVSVVPSEEFPAGIDHDRILRGKADATISDNTYMLTDIKDPNINGETQGGRVITVDTKQADSSTGAHEIGHTVGLQHSSIGLMTAASSDPYRSNNISKSEVKTIIKRAIKGKPSTDLEGTAAGKGNFHNISNNAEDTNIKFKFKMEDLNK